MGGCTRSTGVRWPLMAAALSASAAGCAPDLGVELDVSGAQVTREDGSAVTVQVSLAERPLGTVSVQAFSDDETEGRVSAAVRFTPTNWQVPQAITITGVDDDVADGDVTFHVRFEAKDSLGLRETPVVIDELTLVNRDDDAVTFRQLVGVSHAYAASTDGNTVVGSAAGRACRWTDELGLELLPGNSSAALGVSPNGKLITGGIAQEGAPRGHVAAVWGDPAAAPVPVPLSASGIGAAMYEGRRVLDDGTLFGACTQFGYEYGGLGCRWDAKVLQVLSASRINAADATGAYAGIRLPEPRSGYSTAWAVLSGELLDFPADAACIEPLRCRAELQAFTPDHSLAVGTASLPQPHELPSSVKPLIDNAIVYRPGQRMQRLADLPGGEERAGAYAVSADGRIIVGFGTDSTARQAALWIDGTPQSLATFLLEAGVEVPSGWVLSELRAISADGRVLIGNGIAPNGEPTAFRVELATVP